MRNPQRSFFGFSLALVMAIASLAVLAQPIYKTVDEDGNVVYTDQRPSDDADPIELPEISVVDPIRIGDHSAISSESGNGSENDSENEREIAEIRILSPQPDQTIVNTAYAVTVSVGMEMRKPQGAQFEYIVDGEVERVDASPSVTLEEIWRGEHSLRVVLRSANGNILAQSEPVRFFVRQTSIQHPRPGGAQ